MFGFFFTGGLRSRLDRIIIQQEVLMSLGQDILDAITAESTKVDSIVALLNGLVANNTIDEATAQKIKDAIAGDTAKLEAAISANTPPPPPTP